jgi:transcription elongation factor GreA
VDLLASSLPQGWPVVNHYARSRFRIAALPQFSCLRATSRRPDAPSPLAIRVAIRLGDVQLVTGHGPRQGPWPPFSWKKTMEKIPMTRGGYDALDEELKILKSVERPAVIRAIAEAREHGDLSENAEYHSAREKQSFIEGRIKELEGILSLAEVIDPTKLSGSIKFGATVVLVDEDTDEEKKYQIVGETEADIERGLLNIRSPLARALIGKDEGDSVEVKTPGGDRSYEVLSIRYV